MNKYPLNMKAKVVLFIKVAVTGLILIFLVKNNQYNLNNIKLGFYNYQVALVFFVLTCMQLALYTCRTQLLMVYADSKKFRFKKIFFISWASVFINCIAPSSVFGDLFRMKKLMDIDDRVNKDNSVYASIFSKAFSILALALITVIGGLISLKSFSLKLRWLLVCLIGIMLFFSAVYFSESGACRILCRFIKSYMI